MSARPLPVVLALGVLLVACSGKTASNGPGTDGGTGTCTTAALAAKRVCVPGTAKAGVPITLDAEGEGCTGCGASILPCVVGASETVITVDLQLQTCPQDPGVACPALCGIPQVKCTLPALTPGSYLVQVGGSSGRYVHQLVVTADATEDACSFPQAGLTPPPIVATDYKQTCTGDADCTLIQSGNPCAVCGCPDAAIATSSQSAYEADLRARNSQCPSSGLPPPPCPLCIGRKAVCDAGTCKAVNAP